MKVAVVKYNAGNIRSVDYALKRLGVEAVITADKEELQSADKVMFPGVGEAETTMNHLKATGLDELIKNLRQPVLGICLGMQTAVIEYARDVLGYADANSGEFTPEGKHNVIDLMPEQEGIEDMGGTMRLGAYPCVIKPDSLMAKAYGQHEISERHRHRYEFNNDFREEIENAGMKITGTSPNGLLVEAVEVPDNRFFVAVQYHPEFKSRPNRAHPLFREFIKASLEK